MGWKGVTVMDQKMRFILEYRDGFFDFTSVRFFDFTISRHLDFSLYASRFTVYDFTHPSFELMMVLVLFVKYLQTFKGEEFVDHVDRLGALVDQA